jgi:hypothetical protein
MIPNRWTHRLTAERETNSTETDEYGAPLPGGTETVVDSEPFRHRPESTTYVRTETGERVQRAATLVTRGHLFGELQEGDTLELTPLGGGTTISDVEVVGVEPQYGRHKRPTSLVIEVDGV